MSTAIDLFGVPIPEAGAPVVVKPGQPKGFARPPGTGPYGETCGTCVYIRHVRGGANVYKKCALIQHRWTHGPGTDIKSKSPACELWEAP